MKRHHKKGRKKMKSNIVTNPFFLECQKDDDKQREVVTQQQNCVEDTLNKVPIEKENVASEQKSDFDVAKANETTCEHCNKYFPNKRQLCVHQLRKHSEECKELGQSCPICTLEFNLFTSTLKYQHMILHNLNYTIPPPCNVCGKKFKYYVEYAVHINQNHVESHTEKMTEQDKPVEEGKENITKVTTGDESKVVTGKETTTCEHCNKYFLNKKQLFMHQMRKHSEEGYKLGFTCPICEQVFCDTTRMYQHMLIHNESYSIPPPCSVCDKKFKYYVEYTIHKKRNHVDSQTEQDKPVEEGKENAAEDSDSEYLDIEIDEDDDLIPDFPLSDIDEQLESIPESKFSEVRNYLILHCHV